MRALACLFCVHHWSEWKPIDPDDPSKQNPGLHSLFEVQVQQSPGSESMASPPRHYSQTALIKGQIRQRKRLSSVGFDWLWFEALPDSN